jgi:hypothetical protein
VAYLFSVRTKNGESRIMLGKLAFGRLVVESCILLSMLGTYGEYLRLYRKICRNCGFI